MVCLVLVGGALLWRNRNNLLGESIPVSGLDVEPEASEAESEPPDEGLDKARTVLVVGDDSGEVREDLRHLATGDRSGHRTDTIMLLRIDPEKKRVTGLNFPRDLRVPLCDGSVQKINAAMYEGGPGCLVKTVREFARTKIHHYVQVDFEGFVDIVGAVGGVTMYLEEPMRDDNAHLNLKAGCVTLNGEQALGFVRTRKDTDFGRIARQQRFLKELADEATSLDVVANPVRLYQTVEAVGDMLTVDDELGIGTMRDFALTLRGIESKDIVMQTIPTSTDPNGWYEDPIVAQTRPLLRAFKRGELAEYLGEAPREEPSEAPSGAPQRPEPKIPLDELSPVAVLNASDVGQLASRTAEVLSDAGVQVAVTGDARRREPPRVRILYPADHKREAKALRVGAFPDAEIQRRRDVSRVTVLLDGDVDPDEIEVVGGRPPEPEPPPIAQREYVNAEPSKRDRKC